MNRLLHRRIEILDSKAQPVESQFRQRGKSRGINGSWVNFNGIFSARCKPKTSPQHGHQLAQFVIIQKGWASAAQIEQADRLPRSQMGGVQIKLAAKIAQVGFAALMAFGDDLVARTVITKRFAKRDVHVKRQWQPHGGCPVSALRESLRKLLGRERLHETVCRRI